MNLFFPPQPGSTLRTLVSVCLLAAFLTGCAGVKVSSIPTRDYMALRRGDILTTGQLSAAAANVLQVVGLAPAVCVRSSAQCRQDVAASPGLDDEQRQSVLSELWIEEALKLDRKLEDGPDHDAVVNAYLEAARHAYAYLFETGRRPDERALEERQGQVRDYYNFSVQQAVSRLFQAARRDTRNRQPIGSDGSFQLVSGKWRISGRMDGSLAREGALPLELVPAASLTFAGLRNQYRRDGIGASLVAASARTVAANGEPREPYRETPFASTTVVMSFSENNEAQVTVYDPYRRSDVTLGGVTVPLAGDFTAGYGLWLARSGFGAQSLLTLVGKGEALDKPRLYLMQPYDPNRRTIIMLHGLASSPEAWINVANEVLGDERLRQNYQIWQIYYPTNVPIAINNIEIRSVIERTLQHFDPTGSAAASKEVVLIGHSMGGLLSRLAVSSSGDHLWQNVLRLHPLEGKRLERARTVLDPYTRFEPLPQVSRAVFVAAPHRGTPFAETRLAHFAANLVALPASVMGQMKELAEVLTVPGAVNPNSPLDTANGIRNLSNQDPFIQAASDLPIGKAVRVHSIIANDTPKVPLADSSDGLVPYSSAHLDAALSEKVIPYSHSVQETPAAILEIRRILHLHLDGLR